MNDNRFTKNDLNQASSWPFLQAKKIIKKGSKNEIIKLQTGYGPSGLPHMGTFGEVARTSMVAKAFELLSGKKTEIIVFSDDMDGMRKIPPSVDEEKYQEFLEMPLSMVPDPEGKFPSFAHHNNHRLRVFLDKFNFEYKFISATDMYKNGEFDEVKKLVLANIDKINDVIIPTLGEERQKTYSPILPICEKTNKVLYVPIDDFDLEKGTITFKNNGEVITQSFLAEHAKFQWKVDWAARWFALDIDYEMAGEDLTNSIELSSKIIKILGKKAPAGFNYQLFLDEEGKKISKTKGNGLTIDEWLRYGNEKSLSNFMFKNPLSAKKLYFDIIPKNMEEYFQFAKLAKTQNGRKYLDNPTSHINSFTDEKFIPPVSYNLILSLASAMGNLEDDHLLDFIYRYCNHSPDEFEKNEMLKLIKLAKNFYHDQILPNLNVINIDIKEKSDILKLVATIKSSANIGEKYDDDFFQQIIFDVGKECGYENIKDWFVLLYQILFGTNEGPRIGSFINLISPEKFYEMVNEKLDEKK